MLKLPLSRLKAKLPTLGRFKQSRNLQTSFILGVLLPPFLLLVVLSILALWQLDRLVKNQAIDNLTRAASATAAKVERELAIRQSVLEKTGQELFSIKSGYQSSLAQLTANKSDCASYVAQSNKFLNSPNNSCQPFLAQFAAEGTSQAAVNDGFNASANSLTVAETNAINDRLAAFKQFFPETLALMVLNSAGQVVSSAYSGHFNKADQLFIGYGQAAIKKPVNGYTSNLAGYHMATFAYPINGGSVLASYNLNSDSFLKSSWLSTPIDRKDSVALILDSSGNLVYPNLNIAAAIKASNSALRQNKDIKLSFNGVINIATAAKTGPPNWLVTVASPQTAVLAPAYDAQLIAVFIIGCLLVGFLWLGSFYIKRTLKSIYGLVGGALVFAGGKLDYKIKLAQADEEFVKLADTMNQMAERIAKAEQAIVEKDKEFISVATHELRAPLTAIIGNLSMIIEDMGDQISEPIKPLLDQAHAGTIRLRDLVNDMLDVARLESGRTEFKITPTNIDQIATNVVESMQIVAKEKPVSLSYDPAGATAVMADEAHLRIILNNFVSNAIKYNREGGNIRVYHQIKDGNLVTAIADNGLGIPDDQKAHLFEKFFRVSGEDRKNITGTGLGMYITRQYILAMGGQVWFESVSGQGTTFYFSLPIADTKPQLASIPAGSPPAIQEALAS